MCDWSLWLAASLHASLHFNMSSATGGKFTYSCRLTTCYSSSSPTLRTYRFFLPRPPRWVTGSRACSYSSSAGTWQRKVAVCVSHSPATWCWAPPDHAILRQSQPSWCYKMMHHMSSHYPEAERVCHDFELGWEEDKYSHQATSTNPWQSGKTTSAFQSLQDDRKLGRSDIKHGKLTLTETAIMLMSFSWVLLLL